MRHLIIVLACLCFHLKGVSQEVPSEKLEYEFIHITTDKPFYFEKERLIFQAVALSNKSFGIVKRNDVLYSELLNDAGEKITTGRFLWADGVVNGELKLPAIFDNQTTLYLYVYTPSLLNNNRWIKTSIVINTYQIPTTAVEENSIADITQQKNPAINLASGRAKIYTGLPNQLFFAIENSDPKLTYKLAVKKPGEPADTIWVDRHMVGSFTLRPTTSDTIELQLMEDATIVAKETIAPLQGPGLTLEVDADDAKNLELKIHSTYPADKQVELEIRQGESVAFRRNVVLGQPLTSIIVPASASGQTGAYTVMMRDEEKSLLVERLLFTADASEQQARWLNQRSKLPSGSTPNLLFMVDADSVDHSQSYLSIKLLDSRLVHENGKNLSTSGQAFLKYQLRHSGIFTDRLPLDFGSMTAVQKEAWLLTNRQQVLLKRPIPVTDTTQIVLNPFQKGFRITGRITIKETGEPLPYCPLALANTSDFSLFRFGKSNKEGYFKFENLTFEGENELFLALQKFYDIGVNIEIDRPVLPPFLLSEAPPPTKVDIGHTALLNEALERSIIDSVYTGTSDVVKTFQENNFISKIAGFFLEPTEVLDPMQYIPFNEMRDVFKEILPSAYLRFKKGKPLIRMAHSSMQLSPNAVATGLMNVPALVIVDGVPIFNQAEVLKINPSYVTKYELYHGLFTLGYEVYLGLVHIVTNVDYLNQKEIQGLHKFKYMGVSPQSSIAIGPKGERSSPFLSPVGFWITEIKPDDKGVVQLPIRLTSVPGNYWLTLETITSDGKGMVRQWPLEIE